MARVCVVGGGVCGLGLAMMLARDGHDVVVVERDAAGPPASTDEAWEGWERKGVAQFRQPHGLQARARHILAAELPEVLEGLVEAGGYRWDPLASVPPQIKGEPRADDDRFWSVTGRRPMVEAVFAGAAEREPRVEVIRGERVVGLVTGAQAMDGVPHVVGIETETRGPMPADLVIDAMGRQSRLGEWIAAAGGVAPVDEAADCRFTYYTRYFASSSGAMPAMLGPALAEFATHSVLTLPGDNGRWSVTLYTSNADEPMKRLRDHETWMRVLAAHPMHKHWLDGEAITDVLPMAGVMDRQRQFVIGGVPSATGVLPVADAWACTNPSGGRGISVGLSHAVCVRDVVRTHLGSPLELALAWDEVTERKVAPWFRLQMSIDRARVDSIDAARDGRAPAAAPGAESDPRAAIGRAAMADPDVFRAMMEVTMCLALPDEVMARPGFAERVAAAVKGAPAPMAPPGPDREEMLALLAG